MKKKYFNEQSSFEFVWQNCNEAGLWSGDATTLSEEFCVSEDEAYDMLSELCDKSFLQRVGKRDFIIVRWRERDEFNAE